MSSFKKIILLAGAIVAPVVVYYVYRNSTPTELMSGIGDSETALLEVNKPQDDCVDCLSHATAGGVNESGVIAVSASDKTTEPISNSVTLSTEVADLFKSFKLQNSNTISAADLAFVQEASVGDLIELSIPGATLTGHVDSVADKQKMRAVGVTLDDFAGRAVVQISESGRLIGHIVFDGEALAFDISGDKFGEWQIRQTTYSHLFCAPDGAVYSSERAGEPVGLATRAMSAAAPLGFTPIKKESLPGAAYVLYIDLDGENVTSPFWNGGNTINAPSHPQANNDSWVTVVWARIAEDFAPFNINVTTDRNVFNSADADKRVMCVVTPDQSWYPSANTIGGVARRNSFGDDIVCWGFNTQEIGVSEVVSHEVGHTLGLIHDGVAGDGDQYFDGHGTGDVVSWAPIMGSGYTKAVTQWSRGEYQDAVHYSDVDDSEIPNTQDDITVILGNGFGYRMDDASNTTASANGLALTGSLISDGGIIEREDDVDFFRINSLGGDAVFNVQALDVESTEGESGSQYAGGNLAIQVTLLDDSDNVIDSFNNPDQLGGSLSVNLAEGVFYLKIENAERGDPLTDGFSTYSSLGQYFITGSIPSGPLSIFGGQANDQYIADGDPSTEANNGTFVGSTSLIGGGVISSTFRLTNTGAFDITVTSLTLGLSEFSTDAVLPLVIPVGTFSDITVSFNATKAGLFDTSMSFEYSTAEPKNFTYSIPLGAVVSKTASEDNYEENDTYFDAYTLPEQVFLSGISGPGRQSDNDWYRLNVLSGFNEITVDCTFSSEDGDINIALYDYRGYLLAISEDTGDSESIRFVGRAEGGAYRVRVYGEGAGNDYDLYWQGNAPLIPVPGTEDNYEENDNYNNVTDLTNYRGQNLSDKNGEGTQFDRDFYRIRIGQGHNTINVQLTETGTSGTAFVVLKDDVGRVLTTSALGQITYSTTRSDRIYLLTVDGDNQGQTYDLTYDSEFIAEPPRDDSDDLYENNDTFFQPYDLTDDEGDFLPRGEARQFDPDWYKIESKAGENAILVTLSPSQDTLKFALFDSRGYQINEAVAPDVFELLPVRTPFEVTTYYVKVVGDGSGERYDFSWESTLIPEGDDIYETNNTFATAFNLKSQEAVSLSDFSEEGIQKDEDWYQIAVGALDNELIVTVDFDDSEGNIDVYLYADESTIVAQSTTNNDQETFLFTVPAFPDDVEPFVRNYRILVTGDNAGNSYDLVWESTTDSDDDAYEENDLFDEAYLMPQTNGSLSTLLGEGIQNDTADFYVFNMPEGATVLSVSMNFRDADGDLDMIAWDANFEIIEFSVGVGNRESVSFVTIAPERRTVYIEVYTFGAPVANTYDMRWFYGGISGGDADGDAMDDAWEMRYNPQPDLLDSSSNVDGDKYPAWAEYAFDLDPDNADEVKLETFEQDGYVHVKFKRSKQAVAAGYSYKVIETSTLPFGNTEAVFVGLGDDLGEYEEVIYRSNKSKIESPSCFFVVRLSAPQE